MEQDCKEGLARLKKEHLDFMDELHAVMEVAKRCHHDSAGVAQSQFVSRKLIEEIVSLNGDMSLLKTLGEYVKKELGSDFLLEMSPRRGITIKRDLSQMVQRAG